MSRRSRSGHLIEDGSRVKRRRKGDQRSVLAMLMSASTPYVEASLVVESSNKQEQPAKPTEQKRPVCSLCRASKWPAPTTQLLRPRTRPGMVESTCTYSLECLWREQELERWGRVLRAVTRFPPSTAYMKTLTQQRVWLRARFDMNAPSVRGTDDHKHSAPTDSSVGKPLKDGSRDAARQNSQAACIPLDQACPTAQWTRPWCKTAHDMRGALCCGARKPSVGLATRTPGAKDLLTGSSQGSTEQCRVRQPEGENGCQATRACLCRCDSRGGYRTAGTDRTTTTVLPICQAVPQLLPYMCQAIFTSVSGKRELVGAVSCDLAWLCCERASCTWQKPPFTTSALPGQPCGSASQVSTPPDEEDQAPPHTGLHSREQERIGSPDSDRTNTEGASCVPTMLGVDARAGPSLCVRVAMLAVRSLHQGRGLAAALLSSVISSCRQWNERKAPSAPQVAMLSLTVHCENRRAIDLYLRLGFRAVRKVADYYPRRAFKSRCGDGMVMVRAV